MLLGTTVHSLPLPHQTLRHQSQNAFRHTQKPSKAQHALNRHNHQVTVCRDLPIRIGDVAKFTRGFSEYAYQDSCGAPDFGKLTVCRWLGIESNSRE